MSGLDWQALEKAQLQREPFDYFQLANVLTDACAKGVAADFPAISGTGSYSLQDARPGPALKALVEDLESDRFRDLMGRVFGIDLEGKPVLVTLRGHCGSQDGKIHTDSESKILSILLYLNPDWTGPDGELRMLRSETDLDDYAAQIPAGMGSIVAFRRSENSWHGHTLFHGERRVLQINYLHSARNSLVSELRHRFSALTKRPSLSRA